MSSSKIAQVALYIIVGISVLVVFFFYFGDNLIDTQAYEAKLQKMEAPAEKVVNIPLPVSTDSLAADSTLAEQVVPVAKPEVQAPADKVSFTFMERMVSKKIDLAIIWGYILFAITAVFALVFPLIQIIAHPARLIRALILLVGVAVIVGIAYMLGSDTPIAIPGFEGTQNKDPHTLKLIDMGLISTYFMLGIALLSIFYSELSRYFK
jgi:hypothetical protein